MTPHISAKPQEIAKTVIMPGDPLRAKKMAKKFLTDVKLVSSVRNNYCYTGLYNGVPVSIMSSGMGCASMGIYSYELFNFYNVQNIIRVGTIGSLNANIKIGDLIICKESITDTNYNQLFATHGECPTHASPSLVKMASQIAKQKNYSVFTEKIYTTDTFYGGENQNKHIISLGAVGVEMEASALYSNAKLFNKNALTICTVSDEIITKKSTSSFVRENNFAQMFELALEIATKLK